MLFLAIVLVGIISYQRLSIDLLPDISNPVLTVYTRCSNMPPEEVERLITRPLEEVVTTVKGKKHVESISTDGLSVIRIRFQWGTRLEYALIELGQKIEQVRPYLPPECERPVVLRSDPSTMPILTLAMSGKDLMRLKELGEHVIKRRLEQVEGVAMVQVVGGLDKEIHIEVDLKKLQETGLTIEKLSRILQADNYRLPGGHIKRGYFRLTLRTEGEFKTLDDIRNTVIAHAGNKSAIYLKDVADVKVGFKERTSITRHNGMESVGLLLIKEAGSNTVEVSNRVRKVLKELEQNTNGISFHVISDQARFINQAIHNVILAIVLGGLLAFLVLFFFLNDLKSPVFVALSIPISVIFTFILFYFFNVNLNLMSLGGLALGLGMLVDDSIVVMENIFRLREEGESRFTASITGAREVTLPVIASTLTTIAVFLPIIFIKGIASLLFKQQALAVTFSLVASSVVALMLLPMLMAKFRLPKPKDFHSHTDNTEKKKESPRTVSGWILFFVKNILKFTEKLILSPFYFLRWLLGGLKEIFLDLILFAITIFRKIAEKPLNKFQKYISALLDIYEKALKWAMNHQKTVLSISAFLFILSLIISGGLKKEWLPKIDAHEFMIQVEYPAGISLQANGENTEKIEKLLQQYPEVEEVFSFIGHQPESFTKKSIQEMNKAVILVKINPEKNTYRLIQNLEKQLPNLYGTSYQIIPSQSVIGQVLNVSEASLSLKIQGESFPRLEQIATELAVQLKQIQGLQNVQILADKGKPELLIQPVKENCKKFGVTFEHISNLIKNQFLGQVATQLNEFEKKTDIRIIPRTSFRNELEDLLNRTIRVNGESVPLREFVTLESRKTLKEIRRIDQQRAILITADITGNAPTDLYDQIEQKIRLTNVPPSYRISFAGEQEEMSASFRQLIFALILSIILIYMILAAQFESFRYPFVIMFTVPMAIIGVVLILWITGNSWNVMSLIGTVVLIGIVVNDAIVKVDFINQERKRKDLLEAIFSGGRKRFRPIVMTTVTTVFGMLPMAIGIGEGAELQKPLALAIIGGISLATFLTLFVIPILYFQLSGKE
jgi:HAE1 family hydrophobic/amphiphilic exporter-1